MKKRLAAALLLALMLAPALAKSFGVLVITTAVTAQTTAPVQTRSGQLAASASVQCNFTYGSGGTSADAWIQTSLDGLTWTDMANCHFTTSNARVMFNLSSMTPVTTQYVETDGTLAANTAKDGVIGTRFRLKYTTVGTYAGTTLAVDVNGLPLTN